MNNKQTSKKVATNASKSLHSKKSSVTQKSLAGSVLSQRNTDHVTGKAMETKASSALRSKSTSAKTKSFAGSALAQSDRKR